MDQKDERLLNRAIAAHYQAYAREGGALSEPAWDSSAVEEVAGKRYVVLRNISGVIRVYRVRNDGVLKGMRRWPKELET